MAGEYRIIVDNVLKGRLMACESQQIKTKQTTKYKWPKHLVSAALLGKLCRVGVDNLYIKKKDCERISGKLGGCNRLFGGGFLLSEKAAEEKAAVEKAAAEKAAVEKAAAEKAAAEKAVIIELGDKELEIIKRLSTNG